MQNKNDKLLRQKQVRILLERRLSKKQKDERKRTYQQLLNANGQETYLEKLMFTQLKYQLKNDDMLAKQKQRIQVQQQEQRASQTIQQAKSKQLKYLHDSQ